MSFVEFARDLPRHMDPEQVRLSRASRVGGSRSTLLLLLLVPSRAGCCGAHPIAARRSLPACPLASSRLVPQAAAEYRRYRTDFWGDAVKAEFEERKGDPL